MEEFGREDGGCGRISVEMKEGCRLSEPWPGCKGVGFSHSMEKERSFFGFQSEEEGVVD